MKHLRKIFTLLPALLLTVSLIACGNNAASNSVNTDSTNEQTDDRK